MNKGTWIIWYYSSLCITIINMILKQHWGKEGLFGPSSMEPKEATQAGAWRQGVKQSSLGNVAY